MRSFSLVKSFIKSESFSGILLFFAAIIALLVANSSFKEEYFALWHVRFGLEFGYRFIGFSLEHWVNEVLMSVFFLMVGLEIKRELLFGELSSLKSALLPAIAALGGVLLPALIYLGISASTPYMAGFGIPMATDIAFALGVMLLLGRFVSPRLKLFLVALAVVDDLFAIIIIALFYTHSISFGYLGAALLLVCALGLCNRLGVRALPIYLLLGVILWLLVYKSGIHATIAAVILALCIPAKGDALFDEGLEEGLDASIDDRPSTQGNLSSPSDGISGTSGANSEASAKPLASEIHEALDPHISDSPLHRLEHFLQPICAYLIMPIFAFVNAGVDIGSCLANLGSIDDPSVLIIAIIVGLVLGKPIGIGIATYAAKRLGIIALPPAFGMAEVLGVGMIAGIGFTMSIFVANLAFENIEVINIAKLSILFASFGAGLLGALYLVGLHLVRAKLVKRG